MQHIRERIMGADFRLTENPNNITKKAKNKLKYIRCMQNYHIAHIRTNATSSKGENHIKKERTTKVDYAIFVAIFYNQNIYKYTKNNNTN